MARREKQIQQNYRPIIAVHKWFARRPGTLFRGLTLAEFGDKPLAESFFAANEFPGRTIADPFMGGGTPLLEANRVGCDVLGFDVNPMAAWVVREEIDHLDVEAYRRAADSLVKELTDEIGDAYLTDCPLYGDTDVPVKYFLWVKTIDCENCGAGVDLFPGYLVAGNARHPKHVVLCADCGELTEVADRDHAGSCRRCAGQLTLAGPARRQRCMCRCCGQATRYPRPRQVRHVIACSRSSTTTRTARRSIAAGSSRSPTRRTSRATKPPPIDGLRPGPGTSRSNRSLPATRPIACIVGVIVVTASCSIRVSSSAWRPAPAASPRSRMNASGALSPPTSPTCSDTRTCCAVTTRRR